MKPTINSHLPDDVGENAESSSLYDSTDSLFDTTKYLTIRRWPLEKLIQKLNEEIGKAEIKIAESPCLDIETIKNGGLVKEVLSYQTQLGETSVDLHYAMQQVTLGDIEQKIIKRAHQEYHGIDDLPSDQLTQNGQDSYDFTSLPSNKLIEKAQKSLIKAECILLEVQQVLVHMDTFMEIED